MNFTCDRNVLYSGQKINGKTMIYINIIDNKRWLMPNQLIRSRLMQIVFITCLLLIMSANVWSKASPDLGSSKNSLQMIDQIIGDKYYDRALQLINTFLSESIESKNSTYVTQLWQRKAMLASLDGEHYAAIDLLKKAIQTLQKSEQMQNKKFFSVLYFELGNSYLNVSQWDDAINALNESMKLSQTSSSNTLHVRASINASTALIEKNLQQGVKDRLSKIAEEIRLLPLSEEKHELELSLAHLYQQAQKRFSLDTEYRKLAYDYYKAVLKSEDQVILSYANGYIGQLYETEKRYDEATTYTRRAIFNAQTAQSDSSLFKWEWQLARILSAQEKLDDSLIAYRQTIRTLQKARLELLLGANTNYSRYIEPIYYEFLDLALKEAADEKDKTKHRALLVEILSALETFKVAEVEDYFQSSCVEADLNNLLASNVDQSTAIIYPIILDNRLEIIASVGEHLKQYVLPIDKKSLVTTIKQYRSKIQNPKSSDNYLVDAQFLYDWLVKPYEQLLKREKIENILFVPDGVTRLIPLTALHDGKHFLIENYTVATTPSLSLTKLTKERAPQSDQILVGGITQAVQGYQSLPSVLAELLNINRLFPTLTLKDEEFLLSRAKSELSQGDYSIVHIATHGEFSSDYRKSYLLTYDGKLTMSMLDRTIGLRKYQDEPLDLLVLSACQTAVGDDKAALGLAGVAIKAGARSAIATLWFISDEATSQLMSEFYKQLKDSSNTKAKALQQAQLLLIQSENSNHPYYWAPFLLFGNWI